MPIAVKMPALSPTMEEGTLAKWLVKTGDVVQSGDVLAEVETDKATMEVEAIEAGTITSISVAQGTDGVKVGTVIAMLDETGQDALAPTGEVTPPSVPVRAPAKPPEAEAEDRSLPRTGDAASPALALPERAAGDQRMASPLARRLALAQGIDLAALSGSGPDGRIMKGDLPGSKASAEPTAVPIGDTATFQLQATHPPTIPDIPHVATKLSNMRKTIARRLTESKQTVPHIYLTVDVELVELLKLRGELNASLVTRGVKLSVNDLLIKALAAALIAAPKCNVMYTPDQLISFARADISVAVSTPSGLITPVIAGADSKSLSRISTEMKELARLARENKLKPEQYQGGTASISNMGMFGIKQFQAVINPPQGMILAIGAGENQPRARPDGSVVVETVMSATGSFDHRAIDGADAAALMEAFKGLVQNPLWLLA